MRQLPPRLCTLTDLAPRIASGELTAEALLRDCSDAIAAHDREGLGLSAMLWRNPHAEAEARSRDQERARSGVRGPLHGIPIVVKDNIDVAGAATTSGCRALEHAIALRDAEQVRRLHAAGAVIIGKTNLSEFSFEIRSRSSLGGDVRNPFNPKVTAGGSSGGTAAAVAAGFAVAGLGTDTGGSIRVPASYNGLVGLRPTQGLIDRRGVAPLAPTTDTVGPIARSVEDVGRLLQIMIAPGQAAPSSARPLSDARIGVLRQFFGGDAAILGGCENAIALMRASGVTIVDPIVLPESLLPEGRDNVVDWEFASAFDAYLATTFVAGTAPASVMEICESGAYLSSHQEALLRRTAVRSIDHPSYRAILEYHRALRSGLSALIEIAGLDALIYPTSQVTPESLDNPKGGWAPELAACTGWPALTLPVGQAPDGVPIGLEFLAPALQEARLLRFAADLERLLARRYIPTLD